ncbi:MAG: V-type ATP synthase subunit C [Clostridiales bacterium]|nr:V-type ATP synthase subunit C [Clostridiales bacterium]
MPLPSYPYAAGRIFVLENKLLSRDRVERMAEAPTGEEALKVLAETEYGAGIAEIEGPHDYESLLSFEIRRIHSLMAEISPDPETTDLFFLKYDFHNLKVLLKSRYLGEEQDRLLITAGVTLSIELLKTAINEKDYAMLPPYLAEVLEEIDEAMDKIIDPGKMDTMLDRAMFLHIFDLLKRRKNRFAQDYFIRQVDLINIRSFLRIRKIGEDFRFLENLLLPGGKLDEEFFAAAMEEPTENIGDRLKDSEYSQAVSRGLEDFIKTGSLAVYERLVDDYLLNWVKAARWNPSGIEPVIGYLLAKENEIRIIRIIMVGKTNNLPPGVIRERLRDVYV